MAGGLGREALGRSGIARAAQAPAHRRVYRCCAGQMAELLALALARVGGRCLCVGTSSAEVARRWRGSDRCLVAAYADECDEAAQGVEVADDGGGDESPQGVQQHAADRQDEQPDIATPLPA